MTPRILARSSRGGRWCTLTLTLARTLILTLTLNLTLTLTRTRTRRLFCSLMRQELDFFSAVRTGDMTSG